MFKDYFILLLLAHIIGDFYIQTDRMVAKKDKSLKWFLIHCAYYWGIMLLIGLPILSWKIIFGTILAAVSHLLIDTIKFVYLNSTKIKRKKPTKIVNRNIFFIDQLLHGTCLVLIAYWGVRANIQISQWRVIEEFFSAAGIDEIRTLSWLLALLIIHKPANIAIQKLLAVYKPNVKANEETNNAGRFIGTLERIIILTFLSIHQYSAIGLVLTAKSIARYDKISKEKDFAEYYLLGTLISTLIAIVVSLILS